MSQNINTVCCLNPACTSPENPLKTKFCQNCGNRIAILRNHYHPVKLLSDEGGFGRTYLAIDSERLNSKCVIKQLAPQLQGTGALEKATDLFKYSVIPVILLGRLAVDVDYQKKG